MYIYIYIPANVNTFFFELKIRIVLILYVEQTPQATSHHEFPNVHRYSRRKQEGNLRGEEQKVK